MKDPDGGTGGNAETFFHIHSTFNKSGNIQIKNALSNCSSSNRISESDKEGSSSLIMRAGDVENVIGGKDCRYLRLDIEDTG